MKKSKKVKTNLKQETSKEYLARREAWMRKEYARILSWVVLGDRNYVDRLYSYAKESLQKDFEERCGAEPYQVGKTNIEL